jgi:hypothetical protein
MKRRSYIIRLALGRKYYRKILVVKRPSAKDQRYQLLKEFTN